MKRRNLIKKSILAASGIVLGSVKLTGKAYESCYVGLKNTELSPGLNPVVELEEEVYQYVPARNGAGPMWCKPSTCIIRIGDRVFVSGSETIPDCPPMNNIRWVLFERKPSGWKLLYTDKEGRTREPSPIAVVNDESIFISANPTLAEMDERSGPARPEIVHFKISDIQKPAERILPGWPGNPRFTEHSYRSFATDGLRGEMILFQNIQNSHAVWAFRDSSGNWTSSGRLEWPWGANYDKPQPIRICYPAVSLNNRKVYFFGISDIIEPNEAFREYKKEITGRNWDYDFRRLFLTWSDDITTGKFHPWVEIASREETGGWIRPRDLWMAPDGAVHLLWNERAIDERLRDKFFPNAKQSHSLNYAIFRNGKIEFQKQLVLKKEGTNSEEPVTANFHVTPENRLLVLDSIRYQNKQEETILENRIMEISPKGIMGKPVVLNLENPFYDLFTATGRAGSSRSPYLDILGLTVNSKNSMHYARIRIS